MELVFEKQPGIILCLIMASNGGNINFEGTVCGRSPERDCIYKESPPPFLKTNSLADTLFFEIKIIFFEEKKCFAFDFLKKNVFCGNFVFENFFFQNFPNFSTPVKKQVKGFVSAFSRTDIVQ